MMRILIATDAWEPQVNGVVRSLQHTAAALSALGCKTEFVTPAQFRTVALPSYPEIRVALASASRVETMMSDGRFDAIHIATEGPIGMAARRTCLQRKLAFTTSYHTHFPEYLSARLPVPQSWSYAWLRDFHNAGAATMVATETLRRDLSMRGFERLMIWARGVDTELFHPREARALELPRPIFLYVGRLAIEKNLDAFLSLDLPGSKVVVGDGPLGQKLRRQYPQAIFLGFRSGEALAAIYAAADAFVFPSRTDTFGIVLLEALASGLPIAAFPVRGPADVTAGHGVGVLDDDLRAAALAALSLSRAACRDFAVTHTWRKSTEEFLANVLRATGSSELRPSVAAPR